LKAAELKNKGIKFKLGDKEYELKLDMNTFCELEEVYGDLNKAFDDLQSMKLKAVRALIYAAVKVENEEMTLKTVGEQLGLSDLERLGTAINEALSKAMPEAEDAPGEAKAT
jgi:ATP-dependent protease HslVU (ClpYQ) ATPase subunit